VNDFPGRTKKKLLKKTPPIRVGRGGEKGVKFRSAKNREESRRSIGRWSERVCLRGELVGAWLSLNYPQIGPEVPAKGGENGRWGL